MGHFCQWGISKCDTSKGGKGICEWGLALSCHWNPFVTKGISIINLMDDKRHMVVAPVNTKPTAGHNNVFH